MLTIFAIWIIVGIIYYFISVNTGYTLPTLPEIAISVPCVMILFLTVVLPLIWLNSKNNREFNEHIYNL